MATKITQIKNKSAIFAVGYELNNRKSNGNGN